MNICVITADLYKSREIDDRSKVQEKIKLTINKVNKKYKDYILADFMITLGDEWQGALKNIERSYQIITEFQSELFPVKISFGVGEGSISTKISKKVTEMDGPAFINSREALEKSKKDRKSITYIIKNKEKGKTLNTIAGLVQLIRKDWTNTQFEKVELYKVLKTTRKVAEKLKISQSDIVRTLNATKYYEIVEAEEFLNKILATGSRTSSRAMMTKKHHQWQ